VYELYSTYPVGTHILAIRLQKAYLMV